jgi:hypothetical protein
VLYQKNGSSKVKAETRGSLPGYRLSKTGTYGYNKEWGILVKTYDSVVCLDNPEQTWTCNENQPGGPVVEQLDAGTVITIEVSNVV